MSKKLIKTDEEKMLLKNVLKTSMYFLNTLMDEDFESAKLELEELKHVMKLLEDIKIKRERRKILLDLVFDMKKRGINIDFAKQTTFLKSNAKNEVEKNEKNSKNTQKRQQA